MNSSLRCACLILVFCLVSIGLEAQYWLKKGTGVQQREALNLAVDNQGNTFTTGYFYNSINFGSFSANSSGLTDIYLVKTDSTGNFQWLATAGGSGIDKGYSVGTDASGNVYLTGIFSGSATFGSTIISSNNSSQDIFLAKYNSNGVLQWVKQAGSSLGDAANSVTTDNYGNVYLTGFFEGQAQFDAVTITSALHPVTNQYTADIFIAKYDSNGNVKWVKQGTTTEYAEGISLTTDNNGNIYTTGHFSGNITFDVLHSNNSFNSIFIVKYDSSGTEQWFKRIGAGTTNTVSGIAADNNSNIYLTGNFTGSTIIFDTPNITLTNNYPERLFLLKFNSSGNVMWTKTAGSVNNISSNRIAVDNAGNAYITGNFTCKFSEYADQYGQGTFNTVGYNDVFVSKYDMSGNWIWSRQFGGPKEDKGNGIDIDPNNHVIICGNFSGSINFPVNPSNFYPPVGDYIPPSVNQNINYCGDANYGSFAALQGSGSMDVFIAKPLDLSRATYDFYKRTGSGCNRDFQGICITQAVNTSTCAADSIINSTCENFSIQLFSFSNTGPGPNYNYLWQLNNSSEIIPHISLTNYNGNVSLEMTSEDGCYTSNKNIQIVTNFLPAPPIPTVTNSLGINSNNINVCAPDTQVVLTGTNTGVYYHWFGPGISPGTQTLSVTALYPGLYIFTVGSADSCESKKNIFVDFPAEPDSISPLILLPDTIHLCNGDTIIWTVINALALDSNCLAYANISWTSSPNMMIWEAEYCSTSGHVYTLPNQSSGLYQINGTILINHPCGGMDTFYVSKDVYLNFVPGPPTPVVTVSGNTFICPGGSTTLTASGADLYEWYDLFNGNLISTSAILSIYQSGNYIVNGKNFNSGGCLSGTGQTLVTILFKEAPIIQSNPPFGVICPGGVVQLSIPVSVGNIQWFGPAGAISGNVFSITVSNPGSYFAIYTDTDSCEFILNSFQVQNYSTPYLSTGPTSVLCPGTTVTIEVISNSGSNIQWLPPLSGSDPSQIITQPGTYTAMITACGIQTIDSVTVIGSNVSAVITPSGIISFCMGDTITLSANPGMTSYSWTPGNDTTVNIQIFQSGIYELITTDSAGCSASATVETFTYLLGLPIALNDTICKDSSTVLIGYTFEGTIAWYDSPNGNLLDTGSIFITPVLQNTTVFYMQVYDSVCVSDFEPVTVVVNTPAPPPVISSNSPVCTGDSIILNTTFMNPNAVYNWSGPASFNSNIQNPVITNANTGNSGNYQLYILEEGCPGEVATINIMVGSVPQLPGIFTNLIYCEGDTIYLNTDTIPGANYNWTGPNNFTSFSQSVSIPNISLINSGLYFVSISLGSCNSDTSFVTIDVKENPQSVNVSVNSPVCVGDSIILQSIQFNNYNYLWTGPDSFISNSSSAVIYPAELINSGNYFLTVEYDGCEISENLSVNIYEPSTLTLIANGTACVGEIIYAQPDQQFTSYLWSNGESGHQVNITQTGNYILTATNQYGCKSSSSLYIEFINCSVDLPNVFTPNNDNFNDVFYFPNEGMVELNCKIYNRWGDLIYEFNDINGNWDGTHQSTGKECPAGVYFFIAKIIDINLKPKEFSGHIKLIR